MANAPKASPQPSEIISSRIRLLSIEDLCRAIGEAPSTIYKKVSLNKFPKPIKIGRRNKWRESTIVRFLERLDNKAGNKSGD